MTNTTTPAAPSGEQNLDHLEALARAATPGPWAYQEDSDAYTHIVRPVASPGWIIASATQTSKPEGEANGRWIAAANPAAVLELIALARRAAPVSAPIAGDTLSDDKILDLYFKAVEKAEEGELPSHESIIVHTVRAALANQPAPTAAPEQVAPRTLHALPREVFKDDTAYGVYLAEIQGWRTQRDEARSSQPSEAAPLAVYQVRLDGADDYSDVSRHVYDVARSEDRRVLYAAPSLPAAAPAAGGEPAAWRYRLRRPEGAEPDKWDVSKDPAWAARMGPAFEVQPLFAHQPAQEQAEVNEFAVAIYDCARMLGLPQEASIAEVCQAVDRLALQAAQHEAGAQIDVRHEFEMYKSRLGEAANYIGDGLYGNHGVTDQANAFRAGVEVGLAASPVVRAQSEESAELGEVHAFLLGEAPLGGQWFGDRHPESTAFWWRPNLRAAIAGAQQAHAGADEPSALFAVKFIEQRAEDYLKDFADTEPCTGATVFQFGEAGREHHTGLVELADELRAAIRAAQEGGTAC